MKNHKGKSLLLILVVALLSLFFFFPVKIIDNVLKSSEYLDGENLTPSIRMLDHRVLSDEAQLKLDELGVIDLSAEGIQTFSADDYIDKTQYTEIIKSVSLSRRLFGVSSTSFSEGSLTFEINLDDTYKLFLGEDYNRVINGKSNIQYYVVNNHDAIEDMLIEAINAYFND